MQKHSTHFQTSRIQTVSFGEKNRSLTYLSPQGTFQKWMTIFHVSFVLFRKCHYINVFVSPRGEKPHSTVFCSIHQLHFIYYCIIVHLWCMIWKAGKQSARGKMSSGSEGGLIMYKDHNFKNKQHNLQYFLQEPLRMRSVLHRHKILRHILVHCCRCQVSF